MTLRQKTVVILLAVGLMGFFSLFLMSKYVINRGYSYIERRNVELNVNRVANAINMELENLYLLNQDWATFDDTYQFIQDRNQEYVKANLPKLVYNNLNLFAIVYLNNEGEIIYGRGYNRQTNKVIPTPSGLISHLDKSSLILQNSRERISTKGLLLLNEEPVLLSASPILLSNGKGPVAGTLVMARKLDNRLIAKLIDTIHLSFSISSYNKDLFTQEKDSWLLKEDIAVKPSNGNLFNGFTVLDDIYDESALILQVNVPVEMNEEAKLSLTYYGFIIAVTVFLACVIIWWLLGKVVLYRISNLGSAISQIGACGDLTARIPVKGKDEISFLAQRINQMLADLDSSNKQLAESQVQYQRLFDEALTANYISTVEGRLILCNLAYAKLLGFDSVEEAVNSEVIHHYTDFREREVFLNLLRQNRKVESYEMELFDREGNKIIVLKNAVGIFDEKDNLKRIQGYMIDMTERKQAEEEIKYLSFHDKLTGLYNRSFAENQLVQLNAAENLPLSVIMLDVNGLKLINDTLGHNRGDELLVEVAKVIKGCCRKEDIVCRWGGDEYLVLLPQTDEITVQKIGEQIRFACENVFINGFEASASMGIMTKNHVNEDIKDTLKTAEERMYRNKLLQHTSNRNVLTQLLHTTLRGKSHETEEHAMRLRDIVMKMGEVMKLTDSSVDELELLATLHDIGKIAVPDEILNKPGKLSDEEWEVMKRHSEVGYRIAKSSPEMAPVAEAILYHHERWDGKGYPLGLIGDEIPLHSRIIAIADAYDVMTNGRPYKKGVPSEEAVRELRRCAGSQFDPYLVEIFIKSLEI